MKLWCWYKNTIQLETSSGSPCLSPAAHRRDHHPERHQWGGGGAGGARLSPRAQNRGRRAGAWAPWAFRVHWWVEISQPRYVYLHHYWAQPEKSAGVGHRGLPSTFWYRLFVSLINPTKLFKLLVQLWRSVCKQTLSIWWIFKAGLNFCPAGLLFFFRSRDHISLAASKNRQQFGYIAAHGEEVLLYIILSLIYKQPSGFKNFHSCQDLVLGSCVLW